MAMYGANPTIRGCVLVICNSFANTPAERLVASMHDAKIMKELWGNMLRSDSFPTIVGPENTDFIVHQDVAAEHMVELLSGLASYRTQTEYSYVVVVISTHGGLVAKKWVKKWDPTCIDANTSANSKEIYNDYTKYGHDQSMGCYVGEEMIQVFFGNDFRPIREAKLMELFRKDVTKTWQGIPKFFILNYLRENTVDCDVIRIPQPLREEEITFEFYDDDVTIRPNVKNKAVSVIPRISDVLVVYITYPPYLAYKNNKNFGSLLLSTIGEVFKKYAKKMDAVEILTMVNHEMQKKVEKGGGREKIAMSKYESTLTEKFYLCQEAKIIGDHWLASIDAKPEKDITTIYMDPESSAEEEKRSGIGDIQL